MALIGAGVLASSAVLVLTASVRWSAVGMLIGSGLGPRVARRVPQRPLRLVIVVLGVALALQLAIDPGA